MSRSESAIANAVESIKSAVVALDNLKPRDQSMQAHQEIEAQAQVHKLAILGAGLNLLGGLCADLNRIANSLEELDGEDELFAVRDRANS